MEARYYATCLWPGLPELWWRGRLSALPTAIGFALALNSLLVMRYLFPEWMPGGLVSLAFWIGALAWGFSVVRAIREVPELIAPRSVSVKPDRFPEAQAAYMRGQWAEAASLLTEVLSIEPRDPPALLLLAGVYRHTGRLDDARILLQEIAKIEVADGWWLEVEGEVKRLQIAVEAARERSENQEKDKKISLQDAADLTEPTRKAA